MLKRLLTLYKMNRINLVVTICMFLLSTVSILALSDYGITQINLGSGLIFSFVCLNGWYYRIYKKETFRLASILGALIGTSSLILGNMIRDMDQSGLGRSFEITDVIFGIGIFLFLYMLLHNILVALGKVHLTDVITYPLTIKHCVILVMGLILLWFPYYLTFFPGIFGSDPIESLRMGSMGTAWTNHHPILYTAYLKLFVLLFSKALGMNGAMGIMILAQQMILASAFAYSISYMCRRGIAKWVLLSALLFVTINPVIAIFSIYATKDVLFSAVVLILVVNLFILQEKITAEERIALKDLIGLICNGFFIIFLRNNGSFIMIGTLLYLIYRYRSEWKHFALVLSVLVCCIIVQKTVFFPALQVEEGSFAESLSIPLQQVAQVVVDEGVMTDEEEAYLNELLPLERMKHVYQAGYTDPIKFDEQFNDELLNQDKMKFLKVWFGMLPDNFISYVKAYLLQTAGYWDISQTDSLTIYGVIDNEIGLVQIDFIKNVSGHSLQLIIEKLILVCRKLPVLCYLTNMSLMLFASFMATYLVRRRTVGISWIVPLWISWGTIMIAAPASCKFRYMLPLYMVLPFMLWITTRFGLRKADDNDVEVK